MKSTTNGSEPSLSEASPDWSIWAALLLPFGPWWLGTIEEEPPPVAKAPEAAPRGFVRGAPTPV